MTDARPGFVEPTRTTDLAAVRGRDKAAAIRDQLRELRARGRVPLRVWINMDTARDMFALYAAIAQFDGVLPTTIDTVPMALGSTGGQDYVIEVAGHAAGNA